MHCSHLEYSQPALSFTLALIGPVKAAKSGVSPECVSAAHLPTPAPLLVCVGIEKPPQSPLKAFYHVYHHLRPLPLLRCHEESHERPRPLSA